MCTMLGKKGIGLTYAWKGLQIAWSEEKNFQLQCWAALAVLLFGVYFHLNVLEWLFVFGAIGAVMTAELLNTALEELCDMYKAEHDPHIAKIKDLAAAAVFVSSCAAGVVGCMVFIPHLMLLI